MKLLLILLNIYFVSFTDKSGSSTPSLSAAAMEMRAANGIAIDSLDYAVSGKYLAQVRSSGARIHHCSRWFNGATIETDDSITIQTIRDLPFVRSAIMTRDHTQASTISRRKIALEREEATAYTNEEQLEVYNLRPLHELGYEGQGIRIAICDVGFMNDDDIPWVDSEHFLGHYDFTDDSYDFFGSTGKHGAYVLSFIAGKTMHYHGAAVNAHYYLMRSEEYDTESPKELDNLVVALETADSLGVHIFSASLGYSTFDNHNWDLTYKDINGKNTRASRAATIASRKGMLVCMAAGNDGQNPWHYIGVPADADSILAVGAVDYSHAVAAFSSRGPSSDGRIKPDVCALGQKAWYIDEDGISMVQGNGTSFATPLLCGMSASLWSSVPNLTNHQLRELIIQSSDHYSNPNGDFGYGIPDAMKAYQIATSNPSVSTPRVPARKIIHDGAIWILREGKTYDILGRRH